MPLGGGGLEAIFWKPPVTSGDLTSWLAPGVLQDSGIPANAVIILPVLNDPTAAASNTALINNALAQGGTVVVGGRGVAYINANLVIPSTTSFDILKGLTIRATAGTGAVLVNVAAKSAWTTIYNAGGSITTGPLAVIWDRDTPAWAATTGYLLGNYVANNGNIYWCSQSGTSAGAGGPAGTGTNIVDNTVRWNYVTVAISDPNTTSLYVAINWPNHGRAVGDYIWITPQPDNGTSNYWSGTQAAGTRGGPADSAYFGVFPIVQINDANFLTVTVFRTPTQSFSGIPMNIKAADHDITIGGGGLIDYNNPTNNIANDPVQSQAIAMAGIYGFACNELYAEKATEFLMVLGGINNGYIEQFHSIGTGHHDRIKIYGPAFGVNVVNSHGIDGDDTISLETQESLTFAFNIFACGDIMDVSLAHITTDGIIKPLTIFAQQPFLLIDNVTVEHIGGVWGGGQVSIFGDSGSRIGTVNIRNVSNRGLREPTINITGFTFSIAQLNIEQCIKTPVSAASATGQLLAMDCGATINQINVRDCSAILNNSLVQIFNGTVNLLNIDGCTVNFPTLVGGSAVAQPSSSAIINQINISNLTVLGQPNFLVVDQIGMIVNLSDIYAPNMAAGTGLLAVGGLTGGAVSLRNVYAPNTAFGIRFNAAVTQTVYSGYGNNIGTWFTLDAANSVTPFGFDIRIDVAHATATAGAFCYNTNAASGPLGATSIGNLNVNGTNAFNATPIAFDASIASQIGASSFNNAVDPANFSGYLSVSYNNNSFGNAIAVAKTRAANSTAPTTAVQVGDGILSLFAYGADGANWQAAARIRLGVDPNGTVSAGNVPGFIAWQTANGSGLVTGFAQDRNGNCLVGTAALATNATNGFFYLDTCAGAPSGVPTAYTGRAPLIYDSTNKKFNIYDGAWLGISMRNGALFDHFVNAGNGTTVETDLYSDTLAAAQFSTNGDKIEVFYGGTFVSSGTATRQVRIYFGGTLIFDTGALTLSLSSQWTIYGDLIRVSASVVRYMVSLATEGAALSAYTSAGEVTGLTLANTNILKITGQAAGIGAATNDIVAKLGGVKFVAAA